MATTYQYGVNSDPGATAVNTFIGKLNIDPVLYPAGFTGEYVSGTNTIQVNSTASLTKSQLNTVQNIFSINIGGQSVLDILPIPPYEGPRLAITTGLSGPTGGYDSNSAFYPGAVLVNGNNNIYMCAANTANAAVWRNVSVPRVVSASSAGTNGTSLSGTGQVAFRIPYGGSITDGTIASASFIATRASGGGGATSYTVNLTTLAGLVIGTSASFTNQSPTWTLGSIPITTPGNIPTTQDILVFTMTTVSGTAQIQYAQVILS